VVQSCAGKQINQTNNIIMKKIILSCVIAAALVSVASFTGCASDKASHSETTTTQQTTVPAPVTTTTTDTKTQ
jgi:hypothetical protein